MLKAPVPSMSVGGGWRVETISYGKLKPRGEELLCAADGMRDLQSFSQGVCPVPAPPVWAAASMWALADFGGFGRKRRKGIMVSNSIKRCNFLKMMDRIRCGAVVWNWNFAALLFTGHRKLLNFSESQFCLFFCFT